MPGAPSCLFWLNKSTEDTEILRLISSRKQYFTKSINTLDTINIICYNIHVPNVHGNGGGAKWHSILLKRALTFLSVKAA